MHSDHTAQDRLPQPPAPLPHPTPVHTTDTAALERRALLGLTGLIGLAATASLAGAGPLNPPAGPVASTNKTLDQVEPRRPVESVAIVGGVRTLGEGPWKLTANYLSVPLKLQHGADLNLGGWRLGASSFSDIIVCDAGTHAVRITNGQIVGGLFAAAGAITPELTTLEDLVIDGSVALERGAVRRCEWTRGVLSSTSSVLMESCRMDNFTAETRIALSGPSILRDVSVSANPTGGPVIRVTGNSLLERCFATSGTAVGIDMGFDSIAVSCIVSTSGAAGIVAGGRCILRGCRCEQAARIGGVGFTRFQLGNQCTAESCVATFGGVGFQCGEDAVLRDCLAQGGTGDGFNSTGAGTTIDNCASRSNDGWGFFLVNSSRIERCIAVSNGLGGYRLTNDSLVRANHADSNSVVNMLVESSDNRIEANSLVDGTIGLQVNAANNLIINNSSACPTPFSIIAGNATGPIVTAAGVATNTIVTANYAH